MSYKTLTEAAKSKILETNFEVYPYEWDSFKKLIEPILPKTMKFISIKNKDEEMLVKNKEVVARYDSYDMILYTDIAKQDFHQLIQTKNTKNFKKYIK